MSTSKVSPDPILHPNHVYLCAAVTCKARTSFLIKKKRIINQTVKNFVSYRTTWWSSLAFCPGSVKSSKRPSTSLNASRRDVLAAVPALPSVVNAPAAVQDSLEIEEFLRTGVDAGLANRARKLVLSSETARMFSRAKREMFQLKYSCRWSKVSVDLLLILLADSRSMGLLRMLKWRKVPW